MFNRVSVNVLLKSVVAILAALVVIVLSISAWNSWTRLAVVKRIVTVAEASGHIFKALPNLRNDRSSTSRDLISDKPLATMSPMVKAARDANMPALKATLASLQQAEFPDRQSTVSKLSEAIKKLEALHEETAAAVKRPKAERRQGLAQEFNDLTTSLSNMLDATSSRLNKSVMLEDSYIDQLLQLKQLAWVARNAGGEASVLITNALGGLPIPPNAEQIYNHNLGKIETAWGTLEDIASGLPLPARFAASAEKAKREFFDASYMALRTKTLKSLIARERVDLKVEDWTPMSVGRLATLLLVAETALDIAKEHAQGQYDAALWKMALSLGLLAAAITIVAALMIMVSRRVTGPLVKIQQAMLKLADGDFSVVLPGLDRKDEIGDVSNAVERFKILAGEKARAEAAEAMQRQQSEADRQAQAARAEAEAQAKQAAEREQAAREQTTVVDALGVGLTKLSDGDLSFRLTDRFPDAYLALKSNFNATMQRLQDTIGALTVSAREVTGASTEISRSVIELSHRTEEQAASLEETSASMEEMSATVKKNADNAQAANMSAANTQQVADRGGQVVARAVDAMAKIDESSRKISDIIGVIDEIARQTNLLALNAAVEAARAGEAGRGFAVVASEVRSLAQRSSQAAKDIKDLITNSNSQVKDGVELVNKAGEALTGIVESIKSVATIVSEIANASTEQASGIEQINKALNHMDQVTQQNSALVEENAATAKTLEQQAQAMDERVAFFQLGDTAAVGRAA